MGSRYTISSPLSSIAKYLNMDKKFAFIGKPCDVMALRNYAIMDERVNKKILYMLSFFCAGMPSYTAGRILLDRLGMREEECISLTYRGEGWPGNTVAVNKNGNISKMTYGQSWGGILGRDVAKCCRMCLDGIGEAADISCADGWHVVDDKPDFTEHEGRNVVFVRTKKGEELISKMLSEGVIVKEKCEIEDLKKIQNYQFIRRVTMWDKCLALHIFGKVVPNYSKKFLICMRKNATLKDRLKIFFGTCNRIIKRSI